MNDLKDDFNIIRLRNVIRIRGSFIC